MEIILSFTDEEIERAELEELLKMKEEYTNLTAQEEDTKDLEQIMDEVRTQSYSYQLYNLSLISLFVKYLDNKY